jgi:hypothetical protein
MDTSARDLFEYWLIDMDDAIERVLERLPRDVAEKMDYSANSLDAIERYLLDKYGNSKEALKKSEAQLIDAMARYVGEVFRKKLGGKWDIELNDKDNVFYDIPQLVGMKNQTTQIAPLTLVTSSLSRREENHIRRVLEAHLE